MTNLVISEFQVSTLSKISPLADFAISCRSDSLDSVFFLLFFFLRSLDLFCFFKLPFESFGACKTLDSEGKISCSKNYPVRMLSRNFFVSERFLSISSNSLPSPFLIFVADFTKNFNQRFRLNTLGLLALLVRSCTRTSVRNIHFLRAEF